MRAALRSAVLGAVLFLQGFAGVTNAADASYEPSVEVSVEVSEASVGGTLEVSAGDEKCAFASAPAVGYDNGNPTMQAGEISASNCI
jgi:hypothetical protein